MVLSKLPPSENITSKSPFKLFKLFNKFSIFSSSRRFEKNGIIKTALLMQKLQYMFRRGVSIDKIANIYNSMK